MENNKNHTDWWPVLVGEQLFLAVLSRAIQNPPDQQWLQSLIAEGVFSESPLDGTCNELKEGLTILQSWSESNKEGISAEQFLDLQSDYARLLIGPAKPLAPPWESVYFNEDLMIFQEQTVQVRKWFRRFGLEPEKLHKEPDDHVGLELSFLAHLAGLGLRALEAKDGAKFQESILAQHEFIHEHPIKWVFAWCNLVEQHAHTDFYRGLGRLINGAMQVLAATFDVTLPQESLRQSRNRKMETV
jgi:TorA maturation chaperone TorD